MTEHPKIVIEELRVEGITEDAVRAAARQAIWELLNEASVDHANNERAWFIANQRLHAQLDAARAVPEDPAMVPSSANGYAIGWKDAILAVRGAIAEARSEVADHLEREPASP